MKIGGPNSERCTTTTSDHQIKKYLPQLVIVANNCYFDALLISKLVFPNVDVRLPLAPVSTAAVQSTFLYFTSERPRSFPGT